MRTITVITIILFIMTQVGAQKTGSSLSKIRQKRSWVVDIFTMKRGFKGHVGTLTFYVNIKECHIYGPGLEEEPKDLFRIDRDTKKLQATGNADYDDRKNFTFIFECTAVKHVYERLAVDILIEEPYEPYFTEGTYIINAEEWMLQGTILRKITMHAPNSTDAENLIFNVKVNPNPHMVMFFINKMGEFSFRGCLDYEKHKQYTVVVEAKDQKILTPHSSTATVIINVTDKNDHKPVITGKKGNGRVKETEIGAELYRIQVSDGDSPGSPGWRANFTLYGEKAENFKIVANPKTNEGILSVIKPLDYEETQELSLTIQVENEEPFFSCSVQKMDYGGNPWDVVYSRNGSSSVMLSLPITVENVNEPPEFTDTIKHITVMENTPPGHSLWTFTVTDQDRNPSNTHRFIKGNDVGNLVTIDSKTGKVSTAKVLDRESEFVKNDTYTVILLAVDDGKPPQTGTGTLVIHLLDQNDNAPYLKDNKVTICLPESRINITATDLDLPPFSGPFTYELQDDKEKWSVEPSHGETVNLANTNTIYPGIYEFILNITDSGGLSSRQKLSVVVHDCLRSDKLYTLKAGAPGISVIFICILLMLCVLVMMFKCSWRSYMVEEKTFPEFADSDAFMRCFNDEGPGNDIEQMNLQKELASCAKQKEMAVLEKNRKRYQEQRQVKQIHFEESLEIIQMQKEMAVLEKNRRSYQEVLKKKRISDGLLSQRWTLLNVTIEKNLHRLHDKGKELCDYKPHPYYDEGEPGDLAQLDSISMAESQFSLEDFENLDFKFQRLATKCRPDLVQQSYVSQESITSHHYQDHQHHLL